MPIVRILLAALAATPLLRAAPPPPAPAPQAPHAQSDSIPPWSHAPVWYQILPDRFRNGNPANDPRGPGVVPRPWDAPWPTVDAAELELTRLWSADTRHAPRLDADPFPAVAIARRYGGDLEGVVDALDELHALGIDALYLNPVFRAFSHHKYDTADPRHIDDTLAGPGPADPPRWHEPGETDDPATWTWTPADRYLVDVLLPAAHARGMRVVLDAVFNHAGQEFHAFQDLRRLGQASPYREWYDARFAGPEDPFPGRLVRWRSWNGWNGSMPAFRQTPDGDLAPPVKQFLFDVTRRWMDPDGDGDPRDGIDGWRLDAPVYVGRAFWRDWRALVKQINPDALIIGEVWDDAASYLDGSAFDTQTNYPFAIPVTAWLSGAPGTSAERLAASLRRALPVQQPWTPALWNLVGSHDTERVVSLMANPGRPFDARGARWLGNPSYRHERPPDRAFDLALAALALQVTLPGAPMIYYGDEIGMWGGDDPDCRAPRPWPHAGGWGQGPAPPADFAERARQWLRLRRDPHLGPVLRRGSLTIHDSGSPDVLVYTRALDGASLTFAVNRADEPRPCAPSPPSAPKTPRPTDAAGTPRPIPARTVQMWRTSQDR